MSLQQLKRELTELKRLIIRDNEPVFKVLILGKPDSPSSEEIKAYSIEHPRTRIIKLTRKIFRKA